MRPKTPQRMRFEAEAFPHLHALARTSFWLTGNEPEADDLVGETFGAAYRIWDITVSTNDVKTWLFKILARLFSGSFKNHTRRSGLLESHNGDSAFLDDGAALSAEDLDDLRQRLFTKEMDGAVRAAITRLPVDMRIVIILSLLEEFSYRQIADIAGTGLDDVRSRLYRGRLLLQWDLHGQVAEAAVAPDDQRQAYKNAFHGEEMSL